jgi:hypothetical protein
VLAAIRTLNRLECVAETRRAALNSLAALAPEWLWSQVPVDWYQRYGRRIEEYRFPKEESLRQALSEQIGADGWALLTAIRGPEAPGWLWEVPAVEILRRVWVQQFWMDAGVLGFRSDQEIPAASLLIASPYDPQARLSIKRSTVWTGDILHLTETCDEALPHLLDRRGNHASSHPGYRNDRADPSAIGAQAEVRPVNISWIPAMWMEIISSPGRPAMGWSCWVLW